MKSSCLFNLFLCRYVFPGRSLNCFSLCWKTVWHWESIFITNESTWGLNELSTFTTFQFGLEILSHMLIGFNKWSLFIGWYYKYAHAETIGFFLDKISYFIIYQEIQVEIIDGIRNRKSNLKFFKPCIKIIYIIVLIPSRSHFESPWPILVKYELSIFIQRVVKEVLLVKWKYILPISRNLGLFADLQ